MPTINTDNWREHATCRGIATDTHFPPEPVTTDTAWDRARTYCRLCPVKIWCLDLAMRCEQPGYRHGMFGGLTPNEREQYARRTFTV